MRLDLWRLASTRVMKSVLTGIGLLAVCVAAQAQPAADDAAQCLNLTRNPDLTIKHCTAAIDARAATGDALAQLYVSRGGEWINKQDYDRAIADTTAALKISPKTPQANYHRGVAWANKGDSVRAVADFDAAIALKPDDAVAYFARALEQSIKGDYPRALADFDSALRLDPKINGVHFARGRTLFYMGEPARAVSDLEAAFKAQPNAYISLWLYLARKRSGVADAEESLERETRRLRAGWPAMVIALYMGRTDPQSVTNAATDINPVRRREIRCESDFYTAHWYLLKGDRPRAQTLLQQVQTACAKNLLEYEGTVAELRRLK